MRIISLDKEILAKRLSAKPGQDLGGVCFFYLVLNRTVTPQPGGPVDNPSIRGIFVGVG